MWWGSTHSALFTSQQEGQTGAAGNTKDNKKGNKQGKGQGEIKAKVKASPPKSAAKATKGEEKRKRQDHTKEDTKTPPSKRSRASPKSTGSGKKTFARRFQPNKDPSKTFWAALKDAFERKVQSRVESPSKLEDHSCSKTPWCFVVFKLLQVVEVCLGLRDSLL